MWHTSRGDRTLQGDEATLVREAIDTMVDVLSLHIDDDPAGGAICESGIAVFDQLTSSQRIALLHDVAAHLLTDSGDAPQLSAPLEATVAAIFKDVRDHVAIEVDFPQSTEHARWVERPGWRHLVASAFHSVTISEGDFENLEELPLEASGDMHQWERVIDYLTDAILWDRDFEFSGNFLDMDPEILRERRQSLGIDDNYFTQIAPDPRPAEVAELVSATRKIVRQKPR
ncbi:MAG: hypothetical protein CMM01_16515 [Rhodopirellula sp.]|nr:hypothetical protein [Rhodopirellula sp.]OUX50269.1 MAG: hypothetical protein CBE43_07545 [Rhodopirellula sp. TMED283]